VTSPLFRPDDRDAQDPGDRRQDNLVFGSASDRLARAFRASNPNRDDPITFSSSDSSLEPLRSIPNPYGVGLSAFEPNTLIFDQYASAYNQVQTAKAKEAQDLADQFSVDIPASPGAAGATGSSTVNGVPYAELFNQASSKYGVPAGLLAAVARAESNFNPNARSSAGAIGLMQFLPGTAATFGINPLDPAQAIDGAARYLLKNFEKFHSWDLALAAYNAGPGAVAQYGGIPPYAETQTYVRRVQAFAQDYGTGGHLSALVSGQSSPSVNFASGGIVDATGKTRGMVSAALQLAARQVPYVWGGTSANGVDCSGLIFYAARAAGIPWQRYRAVDYGRMGTAVPLSQARAGDIVYYDNPGTDTDHVGIYIGNGQMVQAPYSGQRVRVTGVGNYTSIRRVFDDGGFGASPNPWGAAQPIYNGTAYNPGNYGLLQQALVSTPLFGGLIGRALAPNPPVIERTQQTGRVKAI
jgi:soluble lytic murein transglycosylase-like protein